MDDAASFKMMSYRLKVEMLHFLPVYSKIRPKLAYMTNVSLWKTWVVLNDNWISISLSFENNMSHTGKNNVND